LTSTAHGLIGFADLVPDHATSAEEALPRDADRDHEFAAGRRCARAAMRELGVPGLPVGRGPAGEPTWPAGLVGSITHGAGVCAAAVARRSGTERSVCVGVGIDAAPNVPLRGRVARRVLPGSRWPADPATGIHWESVVFSAKESVFKAYYPMTRGFLRFSEARLDVHADGTISVEIDRSVGGTSDPPRITGRYLVDGGVIRTVVLVEVR
jgi:4'-phosphopantetheinyl transferase EntD